MKRTQTGLVTLLLAAAIGVPPSAAAQQTGAFEVFGRPVVRIGQDYTLRAGDAVREVTVWFGNATIEGHVAGDLVVVLGRAVLSPTAVVDGSFVVVGGNATAAAGARVDGDAVVVGGGFDAPVGFAPGGQHLVIGS